MQTPPIEITSKSLPAKSQQRVQPPVPTNLAAEHGSAHGDSRIIIELAAKVELQSGRLNRPRSPGDLAVCVYVTCSVRTVSDQEQ